MPRSLSPGRRIASVRAPQRPIGENRERPEFSDRLLGAYRRFFGRARPNETKARKPLPRSWLIISTAWRPRLLLGPRGGAFVMNLSDNEQAIVWIHQDRVSDVVPISADNPITTARAVRAFARRVVDVRGVDKLSPTSRATSRAFVSVEAGVQGRPSILSSGWKAVKCKGTSGPSLVITHSLSFFHFLPAVIVTRD